MKPRLTERKVVVLFIVAQAILALSESSVSAQHDTFPLIRDLNPSRVQVVVNSSSEFQKTFSDLAVGALKRAGIDIAAQDNKYSNKAKSVELILTVKPEPLSDICPGQVMYEPSIALVEEIIVPRANEVIKGSTWASFQPPHIRQTLSRKELEQKISELIEGFIINFQMVNRTPPAQHSASGYGEQGGPIVDPDKRLIEEVPSSSTLKNLNLALVDFSLWAGADTKSLHDRAVATGSREGIRLGSIKTEDGPMLSLKLQYWDFYKGCPGKGIYSAKIELVERVRITHRSVI